MSTDFLEAVEQQLVEATERGIGRRRRWPWLMRLRLPMRAPTIGIAAGVGATLAATAVAATLTLPLTKPHPHVAAGDAASRVRSYTTAGAVPAGFQPESFTAISEFTWWLLGRAPCGSHMCTAIVRTTDGGQTFTRIPAPPTYWGVSQVRFANARDGYAFSPGLWTTHNGGRTWKEVGMGARAVAIADGYVYGLTSLGGPAFSLSRSLVGRNAWASPPGLTGRKWPLGGDSTGGLWVQADTVIIQQGRRLLVSSDQGNHFRRVGGVKHAGGCGYDAALDPSIIWGLCSTGTAPDQIVRSIDSGNTFSAAAQVPDGPINSFAVASSYVAVASGQGPLFRTTDAGATWSAVAAPSADWTYLGFTDATHGVAIGEFGSGGHRQMRVYYTTDAGASYHLVPIGPP